MARPEVPSTSKDERDRLVLDHIDVVNHVVNQLAARYPRHVDRDELWNAGALGLVDAAHRFDATTGTPFARYASIRIRGAIIDCTRGRDFSTRSLRRRARDMHAASDTFAARHGRFPDDEELAEAMGVAPEELAQLRGGLRRASVLRLDQPATVDGDEIVTLCDLLEEHDTLQLPEAELEHRELVGSLLTAIAALPHPLDEVVRRYYLEGHLLHDIADDLGVTEARISQIRQEGLVALRVFFDGEFGGVADTVPDDAPGKRHRSTFLSTIADTTWRDRIDASRSWADEREPARLAS